MTNNDWDPDFMLNSSYFNGLDIRSFAINDNNELIIGGNFTKLGGAFITSVAVFNGTGWNPVGGTQYPFSTNVEVFSLAFFNGTTFVSGEFFHSVRFEIDQFQGIAYFYNSLWWGFNGGVLCTDCDTGIINITIPTVYTMSILPALQVKPTGYVPTSTGVDITGLIGTAGLFEEFGIPKNLPGLEIYLQNLTAANSTVLTDAFYNWEIWVIIFGVVFFLSFILACIINACFRLCGCIKSIGDDSLSSSDDDEL